MQNDKQKVTKLESISEIHRMLGIPGPEHPLITLLDTRDDKINLSRLPVSYVTTLYKISFINKLGGNFRYGQGHYDFDEGSMVFTAPHQIVGSTSIYKGNEGYSLIFHQDFLQGYPLAAKFNNVIVQVQTDDTTHLLDATDKNNVNDLISYQNLNHQGLQLNLENKTAKWILIENNNLSRSNITYIVKLGTDNKLTGTLNITSDYYQGLMKRNRYQSATNQADFIKQFKTDKPGLEITNYQISNVDQPELPVTESMDITIEDNIEDAGNLAYFMPMMFERTKENPFRLEDRKFPVDFAFPTEENLRIIIEFPASYKLEKLPKSEKFKLPDNDGSFSIIYAQEENKISIRSKINIAKSKFTAEEYYNLKELFKNIVRKQAEQIVFKKS